MINSVTEIPAELKTIRDYIRWAASRFNEYRLSFGHGTDNAWDEAVYLVLHALHLPIDIHPQIIDSNLTAQEKEAVFSLVRKRILEKLPAPYLTNEAWFAEMPFFVDERVLIPRSPMAELILQSFEPWIKPENVSHILDLCTGSGCIAIACAKAFPEAKIVALDISADALSVAAINVKKHAVQDQIELVQSDLFSQLNSRQFDIIISNPPYVDKKDMDELPSEYLHEPRLALAAGDDGLDIVKFILSEGKNYLSENGILIVEVGNSEYALMRKFPNIPFTWLEFERGGDGVFLLTKEQLMAINF